MSEPGEKYAYVSFDYYLLGKIIEKVSGETYAAYMQKHIFEKVGMAQTVLMTEKNNKKLELKGYEEGGTVEQLHSSLLFACGDVLSTKEDSAKFVPSV